MLTVVEANPVPQEISALREVPSVSLGSNSLTECSKRSSRKRMRSVENRRPSD
jgi:hypothetical protein